MKDILEMFQVDPRETGEFSVIEAEGNRFRIQLQLMTTPIDRILYRAYDISAGKIPVRINLPARETLTSEEGVDRYSVQLLELVDK